MVLSSSSVDPLPATIFRSTTTTKHYVALSSVNHSNLGPISSLHWFGVSSACLQCPPRRQSVQPACYVF
nr:hypothetical protein Q903MT_gene2396 [Picea sitchensis]